MGGRGRNRANTHLYRLDLRKWEDEGEGVASRATAGPEDLINQRLLNQGPAENTPTRFTNFRGDGYGHYLRQSATHSRSW